MKMHHCRKRGHDNSPPTSDSDSDWEMNEADEKPRQKPDDSSKQRTVSTPPVGQNQIKRQGIQSPPVWQNAHNNLGANALAAVPVICRSEIVLEWLLSSELDEAPMPCFEPIKLPGPLRRRRRYGGYLYRPRQSNHNSATEDIANEMWVTLPIKERRVVMKEYAKAETEGEVPTDQLAEYQNTLIIAAWLDYRKSLGNRNLGNNDRAKGKEDKEVQAELDEIIEEDEDEEDNTD